VAVKERKVVFKGKKISVVVEEIIGKKGVYTAEIVEHPGAVVILPVKNGKIIMIKQYRPAVRGSILELPAGTIEEGEDPVTCAKRELEEETGYKAGKLKPLGSFYASPGYTSEVLHAFLAEDLIPGKESPEIDEEIEILELKEDELLELIKHGSIRDAKTLSALLLYYLKKGKFL